MDEEKRSVSPEPTKRRSTSDTGENCPPPQKKISLGPGGGSATNPSSNAAVTSRPTNSVPGIQSNRPSNSVSGTPALNRSVTGNNPSTSSNSPNRISNHASGAHNQPPPNRTLGVGGSSSNCVSVSASPYCSCCGALQQQPDNNNSTSSSSPHHLHHQPSPVKKLTPLCENNSAHASNRILSNVRSEASNAAIITPSNKASLAGTSKMSASINPNNAGASTTPTAKTPLAPPPAKTPTMVQQAVAPTQKKTTGVTAPLNQSTSGSALTASAAAKNTAAVAATSKNAAAVAATTKNAAVVSATVKNAAAVAAAGKSAAHAKNSAAINPSTSTPSSSGVATKCNHHGGGGASSAGTSGHASHSNTSSPDKFEAREDLVKQIMDMGICRNGAVKALYWTGNKSALAASNWIFDQPERDLDTPLEDELEMIRAQQLEREREEMEREKAFHRIVRKVHHNHIHHHLHEDHLLDEEFLEELHEHEDLDDEEDEDEDEEDEEDEDEDELDMDFKMVFVINRSLDLSPGQMTMSVSKATAGLHRKTHSQAQSAAVGPDELAMWGDFGERTVILWADTEQHIKDLELMARSLRLPCYMVETFAELKGASGAGPGGDGNSRGGASAASSADNSGPGVSGVGGHHHHYHHAHHHHHNHHNMHHHRVVGEGGKLLYKSVLGIFGEERELNKVTGRLKVVA
eukprot:TRINITY_DN4626_c0_g1_i1.p1 TRINITY_DN4626_c0_g1~~TRINITY_DN4626_c0_g1_i1.p1  ORF type:complete len:688 (+),score=214.90 TRINITY_DN4626_c0_g1_i1:131-2194(+)